MRAWKQTWKFGLLGLLIAVALPAMALAAQSESPNYQVNEVFFGSGGELNACSTSYCSKQSAGETVVGNTASSNYQAQGGFNTDRQPYIQFSVNNTNINLGTLKTTTTATATATFSVKTYLAHGYNVTTVSPPPTNGAHELTPIGSAPAPSQAGKEQFGINLASNTVPATFGAGPVENPDTTFAYGVASDDYDQPNYFKYAQGDIIADSTQSTSDTTFTISYIFNISNVTPGGTYSFHDVLVATSTY